MESNVNEVVLSDLRRATQYEVQVRARTFAGYGSFGQATVFRTLPDGKKRSCSVLWYFISAQLFVPQRRHFIDFVFLSLCRSKPFFFFFFEIVSHLLPFLNPLSLTLAVCLSLFPQKMIPHLRCLLLGSLQPWACCSSSSSLLLQSTV